MMRKSHGERPQREQREPDDNQCCRQDQRQDGEIDQGLRRFDPPSSGIVFGNYQL
jgi:hypothetical protein